MRNLTRHLRPTKDVEALVRKPIRGQHLVQAGTLVCETCHSLADVDEILAEIRTGSELVDSWSETLQKGVLLDEKLVAWSEQLPEDYVFTSIQATDCSPENTPALQSLPSFHVYSNIPTASTWNLNRITRILLLTNMTRLSSALAKIGGQQLTPAISATYNLDAAEKIQSLVNDICASVPYLLGEVDQQGMLRHPQNTRAIGGLQLLFPLRTLVFMESIDPRQKAWMRLRLAHVRNTLGIQGACLDGSKIL